MKKRILFVTPYPRGKAGSQRFRFEMFYDILEPNGYEFTAKPFFSERTWEILYLSGHIVAKVAGTLAGYLRRVILLFSLNRYDFVFVHREATPLGPPFFEWVAVKVFGKKMIYDFDDAIWKRDFSEANKLAALLKRPGKVADLCRWSWRISAGNQYLADYAKKYNKNVKIIPTIVDTENVHNRLKRQDGNHVHIGWTGTHTTLKYLEPIIPVLHSLSTEFSFKFYIICNLMPKWDHPWIHFVPWNKATELEDLLRFNIGLMPLPDDEWANGKCGFKAIQYMALGIPPVADAVGMNTRLIEDGKSGFLVRKHKDWANALRQLLTDEDLRISAGAAARNKVISHYSRKHNTFQFLDLFILEPTTS